MKKILKTAFLVMGIAILTVSLAGCPSTKTESTNSTTGPDTSAGGGTTPH